MNNKLLDSAIRKVPDFPRPGILFYDITGILANPEAFRFCIDELSALARSSGAGALAAIESRGFVFAAPVADRCGLPLILVRKKGKLPGATVSRSFALEYGEDHIEVQKLELEKPRRIFIIDDLLATGGTMEATVNVFREHGSEITAVGAVVGLPFLGYGKVLAGIPVHALLNYETE
ncbi:MAG: adenine phosphoribosyltransferase [Spirochaetaceae bacterium]|nr:adenine phosphoribosyltransferase [Spirochaetaceae bacterium]